MVAFQEIPVDLRDPGIYMEIDSRVADADSGVFPLRGLIIGQKVAGGTGAISTPHFISSEQEAEELAGAGSMASREAAAWLAENRATELDMLLLDDDGAGVQATGTITFGGSVSAGTVALYIGGERILVGVASGDTLADIATAAESAIALTHGLPLTAAVNVGDDTQLITTARNKGEVGNSIDMRDSHLDGESLPSGLTVVFEAMTGGTGNPSTGLTTALAGITGTQYDIIAHPYHDAASLTVIEAEMAARADAMAAIPGSAITGATGSQGVLAALGNGRNNQYSSIVGFESFPGVPCERASAIAAIAAFYGSQDPARPFQTLPVQGYVAAKTDRFSQPQRDNLLRDGVALTKAGGGDVMQVARLITTHKETSGGAPTEAFLDVNTLLSLSYVRRSFVARMSSIFPRPKVADDGGPTPGPGDSLVTPSVYRGESVAWYQGLVDLGICENIEGFKANSTFDINPPDRMDVVLAVYLVSPLRVVAALNQFRK